MIIAQIHSRPKKGETWKDYVKTNPFNRPSLAFSLSKDLNGLYVSLNYGLNGKPNTPYAKLKWEEVGKIKIKRGKWYNVRLHVKYSLNSDGFVKASINNKHLTPFNGKDYKYYGANMHNTAPVYFKFGLYRYFKNSTIQSIYLDEFKTSIKHRDVE